MIISSENLLDIINAKGIENSIYQKAEILQIAICDYPSPVQEPIHFLNILEKEIGNPLTFDRIHSYQTNLDLNKDGWKAESLSVILHIFNGDKNLKLNEILEELSSFYFTNKNTFESF